MISSDTIQQAKILVIDDESDNLLIIREYLNDSGYQNIQTTLNPHDAVGLLRNKIFDLILLDLTMPEIDGFDVLRYSKEQREKSGPIIIITARQDNESRIKALKTEGVRDFLCKPFIEEELLLRVRNMLEMHLTQKHLNQKVRERTSELENRNEQLRQNQLEMIERIGLAAEFRDNDTGFHITRMSRYSEILGLKIGLSPSEAELLMITSPMHDVGKIGIPDHILLKPGKLDPREWEIMKKHPAIGARILSDRPSKMGKSRKPSKLVKTGRIIALTHHDKWDGTGYPRGLKGEQIPLFGRIVSVADVFDALTSVRPYKKAWMEEAALDLIISENGTQFDPQVSQAFTDVFPQIIDIKNQYQD